MKIDDIRATRGGTGWPHVAKESGCMGHDRLALVAPLLHFLLSEVLFHGKQAPTKFQVIWTPFRSLKVKNIEKEVFWFS
jgi:hypothetical protein